jgi:hypothetical protein
MRAAVAPTGVAGGDAGAVDVDPFPVGLGEAPFAGDGKGLGGERLVDLDQVHVGELEPGAVQRGRGGRAGADAHGRRRHAGHRPGDQADQRA